MQERLKNAQHIQASNAAFAAMKDGSIVTWRGEGFGCDSSSRGRPVDKRVTESSTGEQIQYVYTHIYVYIYMYELMYKCKEVTFKDWDGLG